MTTESLINLPEYYFSKTHGHMRIDQMNDAHLVNALARLTRQIQADEKTNQPNPSGVVKALQQEVDRRKLHKTQKSAVEKSAKAITSQHTTANEKLIDATLRQIMQTLAELLNRSASTALNDNPHINTLRQLLVTSPSESPTTPTTSEGTTGSTGPTVVRTTPDNQPVHIRADTLLSNKDVMAVLSTNKAFINVLAQYGVHRFSDFSQLAEVDLLALRFVTAVTIERIHGIVQQLGIQWNPNSCVLLRDAYIPAVLNPTASSVELFTQQAQHRLTEAFQLLAESKQFPNAHVSGTIDAIDRICKGVKTRLSRAAYLAVICWLVRRGTDADDNLVFPSWANFTPCGVKRTQEQFRKIQRRNGQFGTTEVYDGKLTV